MHRGIFCRRENTKSWEEKIKQEFFFAVRDILRERKYKKLGIEKSCNRKYFIGKRNMHQFTKEKVKGNFQTKQFFSRGRSKEQ